MLDKTYVFVHNNGNIVKRREIAFTLKDATLIEELESTDNIMIPKRSFISLKHGIMTPKSEDLSLLTE